MNSILLCAVFLLSFISLLSYIYCWQDIKKGKPHILSLRQITGIMDRKKLNILFGQPGDGYYYSLAPEMRGFVMDWRRRHFYRECITDFLCFYGAWRYLMLPAEPFFVSWFTLLAVICQGINLVYSIELIRKWGHQIREELENSED